LVVIKSHRSRAIAIFLIVAIVLGIGFRFFQLDRKLFWHDEAYTSIRAAGYTRHEIDEAIFQNRVIPAPELQKFQNIKPGSTVADTVNSLIKEDPQHPPLYFVLARYWMQWFGGSRAASRSLPALISVLALPFMYLLAWELWRSRLTSLLATALLALSPLEILFAQIARQYSLLGVSVLASSWLLVRAIKRSPISNNRSRCIDWGLYVFSNLIGLYAHPFFGLALIAHGLYVGFDWWRLVAWERWWQGRGENSSDRNSDLHADAVALDSERSISSKGSNNDHPDRGIFNNRQPNLVLFNYAIAAIATTLLYAPWLKVILDNYYRAAETTSWTKASLGIGHLIRTWVLIFTDLFNDYDFGYASGWTYLWRLPYVLIMFLAIASLCRRANPSTRTFLLTAILVPFLILMLPDLILGGRRSAVARYLIPCFPLILLTVGYWLAQMIDPVIAPGAVAVGRGRSPSSLTPTNKDQNQHRQWFGKGILAAILTLSVFSNWVNAYADTSWTKDLSYHNAEIARIVNAAPQPLIISDIGDDYTNTGDLLSLSYILAPKVQLLLLGKPIDPQVILQQVNSGQFDGMFVFRPSFDILSTLPMLDLPHENIFPAGKLWQVQPQA
jgi:uncharacterized membrane protein